MDEAGLAQVRMGALGYPSSISVDKNLVALRSNFLCVGFDFEAKLLERCSEIYFLYLIFYFLMFCYVLCFCFFFQRQFSMSHSVFVNVLKLLLVLTGLGWAIEWSRLG